MTTPDELRAACEQVLNLCNTPNIVNNIERWYAIEKPAKILAEAYLAALPELERLRGLENDCRLHAKRADDSNQTCIELREQNAKLLHSLATRNTELDEVEAELSVIQERLRAESDDRPSDEVWVRSIARTLCNHEYVLDGYSHFHYLKFDCTPDDDYPENYPGADVLICEISSQTEVRMLSNATRGQVIRLLNVLKITKDTR